MVCSSGVGFDPVVNGTRYTFDTAGLYNGLFVMADRQTGSVWTHYDGTIIQGDLAGQDVRLEIRPIVHVRWGEWKSDHPDTMVLDWYPEHANRYRDIEPGQGRLGPAFQQTLLNWDDRLPENELVLGAGVGDAFRAYVLSDLGDQVTVVEDELGGHPIVVFADPAEAYALAFSAVVDGAERGFTARDGDIVDDRGNVWSLDGEAISGPDAGTSLSFVTSFVTEWYGWAAYHPDTTIHGR